MFDSLTGGLDSVKNAGAAVDKIKDSLGGITDEASAEAAAPDLEEASGVLAGLASKVDSLPGPIKSQVTGKVGEFGPQIDGLISKASAIPGVGAIIQPHVDSLKATIASMSS